MSEEEYSTDARNTRFSETAVIGMTYTATCTTTHLPCAPTCSASCCVAGAAICVLVQTLRSATVLCTRAPVTTLERSNVMTGRSLCVSCLWLGGADEAEDGGGRGSAVGGAGRDVKECGHGRRRHGRAPGGQAEGRAGEETRRRGATPCSLPTHRLDRLTAELRPHSLAFLRITQPHARACRTSSRRSAK